MGPILFPHMPHQFRLQLRRGFGIVHQGHIGVDALALDLMRITHHRGLRDRVMQYQRALDFGGAHAMGRRR